MFKKTYRRIRAELQWYMQLLLAYIRKYPFGLFLIIIISIIVAFFSVSLIIEAKPHSEIPSSIPGEQLSETPDSDEKTAIEPLTSCGFLEFTSDKVSYLFSFSSPGVFFSVLMAVVTFSGFLISLSRIEELLGRVTSLKEFLEHATKIIDNAKKQGDEIWITCHSPLVGNLSRRGCRDANGYKDKLYELARADATDIHILCLDSEDMLDYYRAFLQKRYDQEEVIKAFKEVVSFFGNIGNNKLHIYTDSISNIAPFFFVGTRYEAVIATPLHLPPLEGVSGDSKGNRSSENTISAPNYTDIDRQKDGSCVDFVGFYSKDVHVVDKFIESIRGIINNGPGEKDHEEFIKFYNAFKNDRSFKNSESTEDPD